MHYLTFLLLLFSLSGTAQNALFPVSDARARGLGGSGLTVTGVHAVFTNPAGLGLGAAGLQAQATGEQRFGISDLMLANAGLSYGRASDGFGLQLASFGFDAYRETRVGLVYGRRLADGFAIGAEVTGFGTQTENYAGSFDATFGLGFQLVVNPKLTLGARVFGPVRVERIEGDELPQVLSAGLGYRPNERVGLYCEAVQDSELDFYARGGVEYLPVEEVTVRLGVVSGEGEFTFGLGYSVGEHLRVDAVGAYHRRLGFSPGLGLSFH